VSLRVFISSTSQDLADYRQAAVNVCNELKLIPIAMEFFSAMGAGATEGSKQKIDESTLYIGIFAHRYGYIEEGYDRSVTEVEFDYADERGLDRLCFLVDPSYPWPPDAIDYTQLEALNRFKQKINTTLIRSQFTTVDDFRAKLMSGLVGWQQRNPDKFQLESRDEVREPIERVPPLPSLLVGREDDVRRLKTRLGVADEARRKAVTVVRGWPGVGKTTLVTALAHDPEVVQAFPDSVLWASIGENADPLQELKAWAHTLGADLSNARTLEDAMSQVRALLHNQQALLIVDDVWGTDAALPFLIGGADCASLITTRFADVAREIADIPDDVYVLDRLSDDRGVELLAQLTPTVVGRFPEECRKLVSDLEGLPLALRVAGRLLENEASAGFDVKELFESFSNEATLVREKAPEDRFDPRTGTTPTIQLLLEKSTDRLDSETREYFTYLGAFAPRPATFDLEAMQAVWAVDNAKPIVHKLVDRGLLEPIPSLGRFWMHAILVQHATILLESI